MTHLHTPAPTEDARRIQATIDGLRLILADRERELIDLKGPCSTGECRLHYAHSGPCDTRPPTKSRRPIHGTP